MARESSRSSGSSIRTARALRRVPLRFALCIADSEPDLQVGKLYQVLPDLSAAQDDYLRVIDESGEDYLYPCAFFAFVELPKEAKTAMAAHAQQG
ncbi:MAG TPA: hypothetical protein VL523_12070 [Terriglobia bacterium]|nr:hypothetical protein [Terriglobia bacterium]